MKWLIKMGLYSHSRSSRPYDLCKRLNSDVVLYASLENLFSSPVMDSSNTSYHNLNFLKEDSEFGEFELNPSVGRSLSFKTFARGRSGIGVEDLQAIRGSVTSRSKDLSELQLSLLEDEYVIKGNFNKLLRLENDCGCEFYKFWFAVQIPIDFGVRKRVQGRDSFIALMKSLAPKVNGEEGSITIVFYAYTKVDVYLYFYTLKEG